MSEKKPYKVTRVQEQTIYATDPMIASIIASDDYSQNWRTVDGKVELDEQRIENDKKYKPIILTGNINPANIKYITGNGTTNE